MCESVQFLKTRGEKNLSCMRFRVANFKAQLKNKSSYILIKLENLLAE